MRDTRKDGAMSAAVPIHEVRSELTKDEKLAWVRARLEEWRSPLFLDRWRMDVQLEPEADVEEPSTVAWINANPAYARATISVYPLFWDDKIGDAGREYHLLHELCHCITEATRKITFDILNDRFVTAAHVKKENETSTEWIAAIVWKLSGRAVPNN